MNIETKRQLYRDPERGKISGVCAGLAEYLNLEPWLVRVVFVTGLIFFGGFFFVLYIAGRFILDKKPANGIRHNVDVKTKVWQGGEPPRDAFRDIKREFDELEEQLQSMEKYVTSNHYNLQREFNRL
ncbi:MAG: envelope stress response membrane protein PspC [Pseudomonadota bacterium]